VIIRRLLDERRNPRCRIVPQTIFKAEKMALRLGWPVLMSLMELRDEIEDTAV
jgi:hypothetical protein